MGIIEPTEKRKARTIFSMLKTSEFRVIADEYKRLEKNIALVAEAT